MKKTHCIKICWLIVFIIATNKIFAQNALPDFSVNNTGKNKIIISWVNSYNNLAQISVQRSLDSVRNFQTIFSSQSPQLPINGFADVTVNTSVKYYYRIFFALDDGRYFFSKVKTSTGETVVSNFTDNNNSSTDTRIIIRKTNKIAGNREGNFFYIYNQTQDSLLLMLDSATFVKFKDSILFNTKDTLEFVSDIDVLLHPYITPFGKPSMYLVINRAGNLKISLPDAKTHHYKIKIFDMQGNELFEMNDITDNELYLEKGNFFRSGWFGFELYEDNKLKERNKFYLQKTF